MASTALATACALAIVLWSPLVAAEAAEALAQGQSSVRSFDYDRALEHFRAVLESSDATAEQRIEALAQIGSVSFNQNNETEARIAFQRLLNLDPQHELDRRAYSPPIREFFAQLREGLTQDIELTLNIDVTMVEEDPGSVRIVVELVGSTGGVDNIIARTRVTGQEEYESTQLSLAGHRFVGELGLPENWEALEYYVEARAPSGYVLSSAGTGENPNRFLPRSEEEEPLSRVDIDEPRNEAELAEPPMVQNIEPRRQRPWYRRWWFWTTIGVLVVGATTTAVVLSLQKDDEVTGSLGSGTLSSELIGN